MCGPTEKKQPSFAARCSSSDVPENQWKRQALPSRTPWRPRTSSTAPAERTACRESTLPPSAAQAAAIRSNAAT